MSASIPIKASTWGTTRAIEAAVIKLEFYFKRLILKVMRHALRVAESVSRVYRGIKKVVTYIVSLYVKKRLSPERLATVASS
jgi:hypothetical protein